MEIENKMFLNIMIAVVLGALTLVYMALSAVPERLDPVSDSLTTEFNETIRAFSATRIRVDTNDQEVRVTMQDSAGRFTRSFEYDLMVPSTLVGERFHIDPETGDVDLMVDDADDCLKDPHCLVEKQQAGTLLLQDLIERMHGSRDAMDDEAERLVGSLPEQGRE